MSSGNSCIWYRLPRLRVEQFALDALWSILYNKGLETQKGTKMDWKDLTDEERAEAERFWQESH